MDNQHSGYRLRWLVRGSGKSPSEVAQALDISNQTLNNWFVRGVPGRQILKAAKLLEVRPEWLQTGEGDPLDTERMAEVNKIRNATPEERETWAREARRKYPISAPNAFRYPVISWDQAAGLIDPIEMAADPDVVWHVSDAWAGHHGFWMKVVGTSMYSRSHISLPEGSLVLVDPEVKPKPGQFFVARLKGTDELIVRQLIREAGDLYMKPLNPEFPMKPMDDNWEALGTIWDMKMPPGMFT